MCSFLPALLLLLFLFKDAAARHRAVLLYSLPWRPCEIKLLAVCQQSFYSSKDRAMSLHPAPRKQAGYDGGKKIHFIHCTVSSF